MKTQIKNLVPIKTDTGNFVVCVSWQVRCMAGSRMFVSAENLPTERDAIEWIAAYGDLGVDYEAVKVYTK
jgi:hypothetical protein